MPCDTTLAVGQTLEERMAEVQQALKRLETALTSSTVKLVIAPNGAVTFAGWVPDSRRGLNDACAYRTLAAEGSWALRQAVAKAEALQGRRINAQAVAAGWHTHDGKTWGKH